MWLFELQGFYVCEAHLFIRDFKVAQGKIFRCGKVFKISTVTDKHFLRCCPVVFFFPVIHNFDDNIRDIHINVTEGNVALIPCNPPRGRPDSKTAFKIKDSVIERSTGQCDINIWILFMFMYNDGLYFAYKLLYSASMHGVTRDSMLYV